MKHLCSLVFEDLEGVCKGMKTNRAVQKKIAMTNFDSTTVSGKDFE